MTSGNVWTVSTQHAYAHLCSDEEQLLVEAVCQERHCCMKPYRESYTINTVKGSFDVKVGYKKMAFDFRCSSDRSLMARIASMVDLPAVNTGCCRRQILSNSGWMRPSRTWAKTVHGTENSVIGL